MLDHFHDDAVFASSVAARASSGSNGWCAARKALRAYWTLALQRVPNLHFTLLGVYAGVDTLVLNYRNQAAGRACEVLTFDGALVRQAHGTHLGSSAQAGGVPTPPTAR